MGVAALILVLLVQVTALAAVPRLPLAAAAMVLAEVTGRVSVVIATASPAARPGGFGALVAGRTTAAERALTAGALACAAVAAGLTAGGPALAARGLAATAAGLLAGWLVQRTARRRLGGMTGDVFGAILQLSATTVLLVAALAG
jgi:adenosylcobinamide-GDP ribazoletransferase